MISSSITTLIEILAKEEDEDELESFLSTEKGFRSSQVWNGRVFHRAAQYCILLFVSTTMACH